MINILRRQEGCTVLQDKGGKVMVINPVIYDEGKGNDIFSSNLENRIIHVVGE